ncbi:MAG: hypothetical protein ACRCVG_00265 [Methanobacteriaceae archaeon]
MKKFSLLILFVLLSFFLVLGFSSAAGSVVIDNSSSEGIKGSLGNDTINLVNGTYIGINNTNITINNSRNVTIQSNDSNNKAVIDCNRSWFIINHGNLTLKNLIIKNAYINESGAVIYNRGTVNIVNCTFLDNNASDGGVIFNGGVININDSFFYNNSVNYGSGGVIYNNKTLTIINCTFLKNKANALGGAIYNVEGEIIIYDSFFYNNSINYGTGGGVIYNYIGKIIIFGCVFDNNSAMNRGGAIYNQKGEFNISDSFFYNNSAVYYGGGAIYNPNGTFNISGCVFDNNFAFNFGGAIFNGGLVNISGCVFDNNSANYGGVIYNTGLANMSGCVFDNNSANDYGGVIFNYDGNLTIINCKLINNEATNYSAGVIYNTGLVNMSDCVFDNNSAKDYGGAIFNDQGVIIISTCVFDNNSANEYGGVIFNDQGVISISGCVFDNNSAIYDGGVIYNNYGNIDIQRNTFINNSANLGSVVYNDGGYLNVNYSRILNNTGVAFVGIGESSSFLADFNWWGYNTPTVNVDYSGFILGNYFVMNVTNSTPFVPNGTMFFNYTFKLNTNDLFDASLLPYFVTDVYSNITTTVLNSFDARYNNNFNITLNNSENTLYIFVTDNEIQTIEVIIPIPKIETKITTTNDTGKNGQKVVLIAKLTDKNGNPLSGKKLTFNIAGKKIINTTNSNGIAIIEYKINEKDFKNQKLTFTVIFEGEENYLLSTTIGIIKLIKKPNPTPKPNNDTNKTTNKTKNNSINSVTMKETGIPIIAILLVFLSILGVFARKNKT